MPSHVAGPRSGQADLQPTVMSELVLAKAGAIMHELESLLCDSSVIRDGGSRGEGELEGGLRENKQG